MATPDTGQQAFKGLRIARLEGPAQGFERFTYPRYQPLLLGEKNAEFMLERLAVGAWLGSQPVGLVFLSRPWAPTAEVAESDSAETTADAAPDAPPRTQRQLLSVMVHPLARRTGLASRLLTAAQTLAAAGGTQKLTALHSSRLPALTAFEALLKKNGWNNPQEIEFRLAGRAGWALRARDDWGAFLQRLDSRGFSAADWQTLSDSDRAEVRHLVEQVMPEADRKFNPFHPQRQIEPVPELSVLLRKRGAIVGWIVGSRGQLPDSFHYSYGYVLPEVQRMGWLVAGVRDVCERQACLYGEQTLSVLETAHGNAAMRRFMERQLKPYSEWTDARYLSEKPLPAPP